MSTKTILGIALSMAAFGATAGDAASPVRGDTFQNISAGKAAMSDQAMQLASDILIKDAERRTSIAQATAPIHSRGDLDQYVATHRTIASPLDAFSPSLRQMFLSSLTFNEKGVTGFRYDVLESLTPTEIYKILSLFGMQGGTSQITNARVVTPADALIMTPLLGGAIAIGDDWSVGYYCIRHGLCGVSPDSVCTRYC